MTDEARIARRVILSACLFAAAGIAAVHADQIRLKDGTEVVGSVVGKDGEIVSVQFPRADVVAINGQPLPPPVNVGAVAPDFTATDLAGTSWSMAGNRGHVTLLQFWAS